MPLDECGVANGPVATSEALHRSRPDPTIGSRFAAIAALNGGRPAIMWPGGAWSYAELAERAQAWACRFGGGSASPPQPIAVALPRGAEMVAVMLGAAIAGRPWSILTPGTSRYLVREALETLGHCDLVCEAATSELEELAEALDVRLLPANASPRKAEPGLRAYASSAAAICFTSGSTGAPKGIVLRHDATVRNAHLAYHSLGMDASDRYLWLAAPSSAASCTAIFVTLLHGACLLPFDVTDRGFAELAAWIAESRATVYHSIPSLFRRFARAVSDPAMLGTLRVVKLGGEALFAADVALFGQQFSREAQLINGLGMSEANGNVCHEHVSRTERFAEVVPIGRPLEGFDLSARDVDGGVLPPGTAGRLHIASASLAAGYWDRELGQARPFAPAGTGDPRRIFQTQDWCYQLEDGRFVHLGRFDGIVKIRGKRVSIAGVEARLREIAGVSEVVVEATGGADREPRLSAWVQPLATTALAAPDVRAELIRQLPPEAIPTHIVAVDRFPLLPGGKIDRRRLAELGVTAAADSAPPVSDAINRMSALFAAALERDAVGADEDFFEAGGDSLAAVTLVAAVEAEWRCCVDPALVASHPTPAGLLAALGAQGIRPAFRLAVGGDGLPLWLIGGAGSPVIYLLPLARALSGRAPIYGFDAGLDAEGRATTRIEAMTEPMYRALRQIQPNGPYLLVGGCFGGWLALDLANRLTAAGERVAFLGMLDSSGPGYPVFAPTADWKSRKAHWRSVLFRGYRADLTYSRTVQNIVAFGRRARSLLRLLRKTDPAGLTAIQRYGLLLEACLIAKRRCSLRMFEGRITVFQAESPLRAAYKVDHTLGWRNLSALPVATIRITGNHGDYTREPHVTGLAAALIGAINSEVSW